MRDGDPGVNKVLNLNVDDRVGVALHQRQQFKDELP